eukprot:GHVH01016080.1.p1 GENE.GHVH01016080.1~~GHVH01016080.1.p1  ORF type:complete len:549 (+),score=107.37 GHVH01016080.1:134-1780(+)
MPPSRRPHSDRLSDQKQGFTSMGCSTSNPPIPTTECHNIPSSDDDDFIVLPSRGSGSLDAGAGDIGEFRAENAIHGNSYPELLSPPLSVTERLNLGMAVAMSDRDEYPSEASEYIEHLKEVVFKGYQGERLKGVEVYEEELMRPLGERRVLPEVWPPIPVQYFTKEKREDPNWPRYCLADEIWIAEEMYGDELKEDITLPQVESLVSMQLPDGIDVKAFVSAGEVIYSFPGETVSYLGDQFFIYVVVGNVTTLDMAKQLQSYHAGQLVDLPPNRSDVTQWIAPESVSTGAECVFIIFEKERITEMINEVDWSHFIERSITDDKDVKARVKALRKRMMTLQENNNEKKEEESVEATMSAPSEERSTATTTSYTDSDDGTEFALAYDEEASHSVALKVALKCKKVVTFQKTAVPGSCADLIQQLIDNVPILEGFQAYDPDKWCVVKLEDGSVFEGGADLEDPSFGFISKGSLVAKEQEVPIWQGHEGAPIGWESILQANSDGPSVTYQAVDNTIVVLYSVSDVLKGAKYLKQIIKIRKGLKEHWGMIDNN